MRPIALKGHERALTHIKYNREGDLLFSSAKDTEPCVWYSENGERLGTYKGHNGAVWSLDVSWDSKLLITGAGDNFCLLWDCETGKKLHDLQASTGVRTVGFSFSGQLFFYTTDRTMNTNCVLNMFDLRDQSQITANEPAKSIPMAKSKVTAALWSHLDDFIVTGHENGEICQFDLRSNSHDPTNFNQDHKRQISDLQCSQDQLMLISASKDCTAKLFDSHSLELMKTYKSERPVNSASISPIKDHIVLGGGEEAMTVTQTDTREGKFDARFYHLIFEDEFARVKGHFGPINTITFHPDGRSFASGGEDGYVRLQSFDPEYYDFEFDY